MAGDHRQTGLRLHQQIICFHGSVFAALAISGNIDRDQAGVSFAQLLRIKSRTRRRAGREVLYEHIGAPQHAVQQLPIVCRFDIGDQALLTAIEPDEVAGQSARRSVVTAGEVSLAAFHFDDPRARVCQPRAAVGRSHRLFQRNDQQSFEGAPHFSSSAAGRARVRR
jgi:hypothetical protein